MRSLILLCAVLGAVPVVAAQPDAGPTFHLEGKPAVDDVFGDASEYRHIIDRFLELTTQMQTVREDFARAAQAVLLELGRAQPKKKTCPMEVAQPYARASQLGVEYLRLGRELTRHHEQIREYDRLGESIGLTPDYRSKVRRVLVAYQTLLTDYREMKVAFHDQLHDELRYAGCNLPELLAKGGARSTTVDEWPQPGAPGAPGVASPSKGNETVPPSLPTERVPAREPITLRKSEPRTGVLFYIDNTRCPRAAAVYLDGKPLGEAPATSRTSFQALAGPHDLCILDGKGKTCGAPGTVRRANLHDGWTVSLRCD
jgi:hypothetical protein